ncbi:hypothetical protein D3C72_1647980 [compost metagenome]
MDTLAAKLPALIPIAEMFSRSCPLSRFPLASKPRIVSLPNPGANTKTSSPVPPSMVSLPVPPVSRSAPAPVLRVSLPPPPSTTFAAFRRATGAKLMLSLPWLPITFSTELSVSVPVSALVAEVGVTVAPAEVADRS